jgi:hypothetical protein
VASTRKHAIAADIARVAKQLGKTALSRSEYLPVGKYSEYQIYDGGSTWGELCELAGLSSNQVTEVSDSEYFHRLKAALESLGRLPRVTERKHYGLNMSKRRFPTLGAFYEFAAAQGVIPHDLVPPRDVKPQLPVARPTLAPHSEKRQVPPIPAHTRRTKWERTGVEGLPYAPQDELGVVALFAVACAKHLLNWSILDLSAKGIDARCFDHDSGKEIRVELKYLLSRASWNHAVDELDYVVCWENRWPDFPKPVLALKELLAELRERPT